MTGRSVGRNSFVDESLFGESNATRSRKVKLSKSGSKVIGNDNQNALTITRKMYEAIKNRAYGKGPVDTSRRRVRQGAKITHIAAAKPTVEEEFGRRRRQQGAGRANEKALSMMDEQLDEVKTLKQQLNLMKVQNIREEQVGEKKLMLQREKEYDAGWDHIARVNLARKLDEQQEEMRQKKIHQRQYAQSLVDQVDDRRRQKVLDDERLEQEKLQVKAQIRAAQLQEVEKAKAKVMAGRARMKELSLANQQALRYRTERKQEEVEQDQRIMRYIQKKEYEEEMRNMEAARIAKEKEMEVARLRAMQERSTDKKAEEDLKRAKRLQEQRAEDEDRMLRGREEERQKMMDEVMRDRARQIEQKKARALIERQEDKQYIARIQMEQAAQVEKQEAVYRAKAVANKQHAADLLTLRDQRVRRKQEKEDAVKAEDMRAAMDSDVYQHRVKMVFEQKLSEHTAKGCALPPKFLRKGESEQAKNERKAKLYKSRPLW